jgi:hypothetical protein
VQSSSVWHCITSSGGIESRTPLGSSLNHAYTTWLNSLKSIQLFMERKNVKRAIIQLHAVQFNKLYLDQTSQAVHINTIWHNAPVELISYKFLLAILSIYSEYSFCLILLNNHMSQNNQYPF